MRSSFIFFKMILFILLCWTKRGMNSRLTQWREMNSRLTQWRRMNGRLIQWKWIQCPILFWGRMIKGWVDKRHVWNDVVWQKSENENLRFEVGYFKLWTKNSTPQFLLTISNFSAISNLFSPSSLASPH